MKNYYLTLLFLGVVYCGYGQVGIGTTLPNTSSELDVVSENKGILIPRVSLTSTIDAITITNGNVNSLLVFNTQTIADITPGYYYWYINKWYRIGTTLAETITTLIDNGDGTITYTNESGTPVTINLPVAPQGPVGLTGPAGATGAQGIAGTNGTNGKSVTGSTYDSTTGIVTFTYSDGTTSTTADLRGATGAAGTNGTNGKSVTGSTYDSTTGIVTFTYSDGTTSTTSDLRGATGAAGTNGTNGTNGVDGAVGSQGPIGLTGPAGANGIDGINGTNGVDGAVGPQGPIGLTGPAGASGIDGTNGVDGAVGPQGPIGLTGSAGANGADGVGGVTTAGTNVTITGVGTVASPYIVNASSPTQTNTTLALDTTTNILTYTNENSDNPTIDLSTLKIEPWLVQTTTDQATLNTQNIYQMGTVAIGKNEVLADVALDVQGAIRVGSNHIGLVGANSAAFGDNVSVYARNSMGIGNQNKIFSDNALIVGRNNLIGVNGNSNAIFGSNNKEYNAGGVWSNNTIFGDNNTMTGEEGGPTLRNNTVFGEKNIITSIGSGALINNNTLFGNNNWSGISSSNSTIFGEYNISDSYNQFIIGKANRNINGSIFEIGIGTDASNRANALTVIPNGNVGIANEAVNPTEKLDIGSGNVRVRDINTNTGAVDDNIVVADPDGILKTVSRSTFEADLRMVAGGHITKDAGVGANGTAVNGGSQIAIGGNSLGGITSSNNIAIGYSAAESATLDFNNIIMGNSSANKATMGYENIIMGTLAATNATAGNFNVMLGPNAGAVNQGDYNIFIGDAAGYHTTGNGNTFLGPSAGRNVTSGSNNIVIGNGVGDLPNNTGSNQLNIGNWIYGDNGNIGIKTNAPNSALTVNGSANNLLAYDAGTDTTIDYSKSNLAYTTSSAGNTFDLQNIKDGGTYTLAVQGSVSGTANFTSAGFTVHLPVDNGPSVVTGGKHSIYTILVLGTHVYMSWITGL